MKEDLKNKYGEGLFEGEIESVVDSMRKILYRMADEVIEAKRNEAYLLSLLKFYEQLIKKYEPDNS